MTRPPTATFFITTGRSGTQWLAHQLEKIYPDTLRVEHEPLRYEYDPRHSLRDAAHLARIAERPAVREHLRSIEETLAEGRSYAEVGFPAYALAPLLRRRFGSRLRLVQLTRNPIRVAASLLTHGWYVPGRRQDIKDKIALLPTDAGAVCKDYAARWPDMSAFEKGLYFWYEVHLYGAEQERLSPPGAFMRVRFEDLTSDRATQKAFCAFLGLGFDNAWAGAGGQRVDKYRYKTPEDIPWHRIYRHPDILRFSETLGYTTRWSDRFSIYLRYQGERRRRLTRAFRRALRPLAG